MENQDVLISVVSPIYRAEFMVDELMLRLKESLLTITENFEIILVEDGSLDASWDKICNQCSTDQRIKGIKLSRNFGQHYAITAGLDMVKGEWIIVMDCDLQDDPKEIPALYKKALEGFSIVLARREERKDGFFKKLSSVLFNSTLSFMTGEKQDETIGNYGIYSRDVIEAIKQMREPYRNFSAFVNWAGFKSTKINIKHASRFEGKSSYNFSKLVKLAMDTILAYSNKPLNVIVGIGFFISFVSFILILIFLYNYYMYEIVSGFTSIILSVWFIGGLMMMFLGVVGLYIGKIFQGIKNRPIYIIEKKLNM